MAARRIMPIDIAVAHVSFSDRPTSRQNLYGGKPTQLSFVGVLHRLMGFRLSASIPRRHSHGFRAIRIPLAMDLAHSPSCAVYVALCAIVNNAMLAAGRTEENARLLFFKVSGPTQYLQQRGLNNVDRFFYGLVPRRCAIIARLILYVASQYGINT